jgi:hypothetical protein
MNLSPMAGAVADALEDRLVLGLRLLQGLVAPRVPVYGVVRVLLEVGGRLVELPLVYQEFAPPT